MAVFDTEVDRVRVAVFRGLRDRTGDTLDVPLDVDVLLIADLEDVGDPVGVRDTSADKVFDTVTRGDRVL